MALVAIAVLTVVALRWEGRIWWCACGRWTFWSGGASSPHNSQHLFDPYTLTHVVHGIALCGALAWLWPRARQSLVLGGAVFIEALWEVFENSPFVIERYRTATIALGYQGDSVFNVLGDILGCALGFLFAWRAGLRWSIAVVVATELILLFWIRDNLLLSGLMLVYPIDAIKSWQDGV